jgi:hypothetical protein
VFESLTLSPTLVIICLFIMLIHGCKVSTHCGSVYISWWLVMMGFFLVFSGHLHVLLRRVSFQSLCPFLLICLWLLHILEVSLSR